MPTPSALQITRLPVTWRAAEEGALGRLVSLACRLRHLHAHGTREGA